MHRVDAREGGEGKVDQLHFLLSLSLFHSRGSIRCNAIVI